MSERQLHKTQVSILHSLRYAPKKRFSDLMRPTGHTSDTFKFHLRKLINLGYVEKLAGGEYNLTQTGKEFANVLDEIKGRPKKQPKVSVFVLPYKKFQDGTIKFLLHKRSRNPFNGYWTGITDAIQWGESFEDAAARALLKQSGLRAHFVLKSFRRIRDYESISGKLLEDKIFVVMAAKNVSGQLQNDYPGGTNTWMSANEILKQDKYFLSMPALLEDVINGNSFATQDFWHKPENY
jgi:predicted transcriptional regulator